MNPRSDGRTSHWTAFVFCSSQRLLALSQDVRDGVGKNIHSRNSEGVWNNRKEDLRGGNNKNPDRVSGHDGHGLHQTLVNSSAGLW